MAKNPRLAPESASGNHVIVPAAIFSQAEILTLVDQQAFALAQRETGQVIFAVFHIDSKYFVIKSGRSPCFAKYDQPPPPWRPTAAKPCSTCCWVRSSLK